jgi:hypothetical protein
MAALYKRRSNLVQVHGKPGRILFNAFHNHYLNDGEDVAYTLERLAMIDSAPTNCAARHHAGDEGCSLPLEQRRADPACRGTHH